MATVGICSGAADVRTAFEVGTKKVYVAVKHTAAHDKPCREGVATREIHVSNDTRVLRRDSMPICFEHQRMFDRS